jgi:uncharacterized protein with ParB-like and HNH nuclease domain
MKALESLKSIFKDRVFRIPDYQRGYAWTTRQLTDFWEDVTNLPGDRIHYTGLLSLKKADKEEWSGWTEERWLIEDRDYVPCYIVDGQQRLTTFIIMINEIINLTRSLPDNKNKDDEDIYIGTLNLRQVQEEYLVIKKPPQFIIHTYKFGYETDNPSFRFLRYKILGESYSGSIQETFYTLNLENAKSFFAENIASYYLDNGWEAIEGLFKKTTQNLKFNIHEIDDDFDVFVAFETMNNRGKKLSNLELLKNRLIYLTTLYKDSELSRDEQAVLRSKINDAWKEVYYQLGRNKLKPLSDDDFLNAHWIMHFQYTREKGEDYIRFLLDDKFALQNVYSQVEVKSASIIKVEEVRDGEDEDESLAPEKGESLVQSKLSPKVIEDYVGSLKSAAVHWYNTFNPLNDSELTREESLWLDRLNRIGIAYFRPLITASFLADCSSADRVKLFKEIERFIFVTFRVGRAFSNYRNNEFFKSTRQLINGQISIEDICSLLRKRVEDWISPATNFEYQGFKTYIQRLYRNGGGFYDWNGLRYFLYEFEVEKVEQFGNQKIDWKYFVRSEKDKVSIEHIYPQTADDNYWEQAFMGYSQEQKKLMTGSLGNLLPLSSSINSSLQNDGFPGKKAAKMNSGGEIVRRGYANGSHSEIEVAGYEDWTPEAILDRGLKLLAFMERRWDIKFPSKESKKELLFLDFLR